MEKDEIFENFYREALKREESLEKMRISANNENKKNILSIFAKNKVHESNNVYQKAYREEIIKPLIKIFDNEIEYNMDKGIEESEYKLAEFYKYDKYKAKDYVRGKLKTGEEFILSNIWCALLDKAEGTYYHIFDGIFARVKMSKSFNNNLYLVEDKKSRYNSLFKKNSFNSTKVEINSQEFEKYFDVYCTNNQLVSKLFDDEMINFMIKFRKELNNICEITLKDNCIYIRIAVKDMFEAPLKQSALDKNTLYKYYKTIDSCLKIIDMIVKEFE